MRPQNRKPADDLADCGATDAVERERRIAEIAGKQLGVVSAAQLRAAGFGEGAIKRRLRAGRLHRIHRGVYLVGHGVAAEGATEMAAIVACGPGSAISHRSAARLWGLPSLASWRTPVEVTVPGRDPGRKRAIRVYRVGDLDARDVRSALGIPATSPARTLLDLAAVLPMGAIEGAIAEARAHRLVRDRDLFDQLKRSRGRRGVAALRQMLALERGPALTRSEAERRIVRLFRAAALPEPEANVRIHRLEVDFLWRPQRVVVEVDGYRYHSHARAFERDRERDGILVANGYAVIRVTWSQLLQNPEAVIARVAATLALGGTRSAI
jgi:very-short-patch-repair endonuclease/predicted transcriptional regulator of viral defense system